MKLLLITGIPGTGKTCIGDYLEERCDFKHLDMEKIIPSSGHNYWQFLTSAISEARESNKDIVITWGFMPGVDNDKILKLKEMGAKMIWFDGNREAARKAFLERGTVSEEALNIQMDRIENTDITGIFNPIVFNTFKDDGSFLTKEEITSNLLEL